MEGWLEFGSVDRGARMEDGEWSVLGNYFNELGCGRLKSEDDF